MSHPYAEYEKAQAWTVVEAAIRDLVDNHDIVEQTPRDYIVGYIVKQLTEASKPVHDRQQTTE